MAGQYSSSFSSSSGSSASVPTAVQTPQSSWGLQLSQLLANLGQYQYNWAQNQFAKTSGITDAQINNYINTAQQGTNLAGGLLGRYQSIYAPMADQFAQYAGQYASQGRILHNMGAAESNAAQADNQAKINAEQQLGKYGIDPSSGRYQDLILASNTKAAADAAAAGEQARINTEQIGRGLKTQAIQIGQQLPGNTVNALNSAYQGISGAENSALGLANTGVNLTQSAAPYMNAASGAIKMPPVGQTSGSAQRAAQSSQSAPAQSGDQGGNQGTQTGSGTPNALGAKTSTGTASPSVWSTQPNAGVSGAPNAGTYPVSSDPMAGGELTPSGNNEIGNVFNPDTGTWGNESGVIPNDTGAPNDFGLPGNSTSTSSGIPGAGESYGADAAPGAGNMGIPAYDDSSFNTAPSAPADDYSGSTDAGSTDDGYYGGGVIGRNYAGGGKVPSSMSPSGGQQVDDVPARINQTGGRANLNVDEFVIPRDVVQWQGQKFFQDLIKKSRQARLGAPAKPSYGAAHAG